MTPQVVFETVRVASSASRERGLADGCIFIWLKMHDSIPLLKPFVSERSKEFAQKVLSDRWIGCGDWTLAFEEAVSKKIEVQKFLSTSSGTAALQISYEMSGIKAGDEIVTTPLTCLATHVPLIRLGAKLVWADIKRNGTIDPEDVSRKVTERTKAIVVVDYGGTPCDLDEINEIAERNDCVVIEDAAQALGTKYKGRWLGAHADFVCFSFQATKIVTTIDGGGLVVRDQGRYGEAASMRWLGIDRHNRVVGDRNVSIPGIRAEMNNVGAAVGLGNLEALDQLLAHRRWQKEFYLSKLSDVSGLEVLDVDGEGESNCWAFSIWADEKDSLSRKLRSHGIESGQLHCRLDRVPLVERSSASCSLPGMDQWEDKALCIPIGPWVDMGATEYIVQTIINGW